jgi:hypothetical protein
MTPDQFDVVYRAFCRRRPFRRFYIEFTSGQQTVVTHPEAIRREAKLYAMRLPDGGNIVFVAECVTRFLDVTNDDAALDDD